MELATDIAPETEDEVVIDDDPVDGGDGGDSSGDGSGDASGDGSGDASGDGSGDASGDSGDSGDGSSPNVWQTFATLQEIRDTPHYNETSYSRTLYQVDRELDFIEEKISELYEIAVNNGLI